MDGVLCSVLRKRSKLHQRRELERYPAADQPARGLKLGARKDESRIGALHPHRPAHLETVPRHVDAAAVKGQPAYGRNGVQGIEAERAVQRSV